MLNRKWIRANDYCVVDVNTTGVSLKDRILEIGCIKVVNGKIVDTFYSKVNPDYKDLEKQVLYQDYILSPKAKEIVPKLFEFIGRNRIVGWCVDFDMFHLEKEGNIEYRKNVVDVFEPYYTSYHDTVIPCSLCNVYDRMYAHTPKRMNYNFDKVLDKCKATMQLYESQKSYNVMRNTHYDYVKFDNGDILWLDKDKQAEYDSLVEKPEL